jgi:hypothetical protein
MTTIREALEAEVHTLERKLADGTARLTAAIANQKAKLSGLHPTLLAVLDHDVDEVRLFFRTFGDHLFAKAPAPAAQDASDVVTKTYADGTSATGTAPLPDQSPAQQAASEAAPEGHFDGTD